MSTPLPVAISTSYTLSRSTPRRRTCVTATPRMEVFAARTAARYTCSHSGLLAAVSNRRFWLPRRERTAHGRSARLGQHLHVVFESPPLLEPFERLAQRTDVHVDRPVARAFAANDQPAIESHDCVRKSSWLRASC
jgi:hypothetical protein